MWTCLGSPNWGHQDRRARMCTFSCKIECIWTGQSFDAQSRYVPRSITGFPRRARTNQRGAGEVDLLSQRHIHYPSSHRVDLSYLPRTCRLLVLWGLIHSHQRQRGPASSPTPLEERAVVVDLLKNAQASSLALMSLLPAKPGQWCPPPITLKCSTVTMLIPAP